jgi:hypothetical protein
MSGSRRNDLVAMPRSSRRWTARQLIMERVVAKTFPFWERLGIHVTLDHFYSAIPNTQSLRPELWARRSELVGVDMRLETQLRLLGEVQERFRHEYDRFPRRKTDTPHEYSLVNKTFVSTDAEMLYSLVRRLLPARIVEVGSGQSTYLMAEAAMRNSEEGHPCELVVIDPHPGEPVARGFPGLTELIRRPIEDVELSLFGVLGPDDILFIDTSHVLRIGGDVQYEFLEVIPRLSPGVYVQIHDIFLPLEYPKAWVIGERLFYNEQYLLQAFLAFNRDFEVVWAGSYVNQVHPELLEQAFASYVRDTTMPGSFWIRRRPATGS